MRPETCATSATMVDARPATGLLAALVALVLALGVLCAAPTAAWAASDDIASGTSGTCHWVIDADGVLTISPSNGKSGTLKSVSKDSDVPWYSYEESITSAVIEEGVSAGESADNLFDGCENMTSIEGLSNLDVSGTTSMFRMFQGCHDLQSIDLSSWDVSNVTEMDAMFRYCIDLTSLDLSSWDVSSVEDMSWMFCGCSSLESIDLSSWDVSSVEDMAVCSLAAPARPPSTSPPGTSRP